jgi:hypothetical protein
MQPHPAFLYIGDGYEHSITLGFFGKAAEENGRVVKVLHHLEGSEEVHSNRLLKKLCTQAVFPLCG